MGLIPGVDLSGVFSGVGSTYAQILYWAGYALLGIIILGIGWVVYYFMSFKYKMTVIPLFGSGEPGGFAAGKHWTQKVKWNKTKTAWKMLWPLMNRKEHEPFGPEHIYPGNQIYAFRLGEKYIPASLNITRTENQELKTEINPVPHYIRNWEASEYKKNQEEFVKHNFWEQNKAYIIMLVTVGACLVLTALTVWWTFKYAGGQAAGVKSSYESWINAAKSFGSIPGIAPGG